MLRILHIEVNINYDSYNVMELYTKHHNPDKQCNKAAQPIIYEGWYFTDMWKTLAITTSFH